jgi:hypothetical protein
MNQARTASPAGLELSRDRGQELRSQVMIDRCAQLAQQAHFFVSEAERRRHCRPGAREEARPGDHKPSRPSRGRPSHLIRPYAVVRCGAAPAQLANDVADAQIPLLGVLFHPPEFAAGAPQKQNYMEVESLSSRLRKIADAMSFASLSSMALGGHTMKSSWRGQMRAIFPMDMGPRETLLTRLTISLLNMCA